MRLPAFLILLPALAVSFSARAQGLPRVQERRLDNGVRVLLVERPGGGSLHLHLFLRGGRADTGALPPLAADLLARTLLGRALPADLGQGVRLDEALRAEEGAHEALRLQALRARNGAPGAEGEAEAVPSLHREARRRLEARVAEAGSLDAFDALGASRRNCSAEADYVEEALDLPSERFEAWCGLAAARLRHLQLARFPFERDRLRAELQSGGLAARQARAILLGAAFPGQPYGAEAFLSMEALESLTWSELRSYARWATAPERLVLVVVGDADEGRVMPVLARSFGRLAQGPEGAGRRENPGAGLPEAPGLRRLQASLPGDPRLCMAWRIPPLGHREEAALQVLAALLGAGRDGRLPSRLRGEGGAARRMDLSLHVPGGRDANLLLVEALPAPGRGLAELEQAALGEVLRLQAEAIPEEEIRRAQRIVEQDLLRLQEDAGVLAHALGAATCGGGDWRAPFRVLELGRDLRPEEVQAAARRYLVAAQSVLVLLEPDPMLNPQDALEARLVKSLQALLAPGLPDRARLEAVVREAVRQLRMLAQPEREATLRLLERQVKP